MDVGKTYYRTKDITGIGAFYDANIILN